LNVIHLGPLALSTERAALLIGLVVLLVLGEWLGRRVDRRFSRWSLVTLAAAIAGARAGYVLQNLQDYADAPWRALALWDAGFAWRWAVLPTALVTVLILQRPRLIGLAAAAIAVSTALAAGLAQLGRRIDPKPLPPVVLQTLGGPPLDLGKVDGRPTVINLWATWCPPCQRELPMLAQEARAHPEVRFVFADQGEPATTVREHLVRNRLSPPVVALDTDQTLARYYAIGGLPTTLFIRADGRLARANLGQISREGVERELTRPKP
jgi:thiol-disulfide isomerase/thioredoxin